MTHTIYQNENLWSVKNLLTGEILSGTKDCIESLIVILDAELEHEAFLQSLTEKPQPIVRKEETPEEKAAREFEDMIFEMEQEAALALKAKDYDECGHYMYNDDNNY
jgi:hypothetical protein